MLDLSPTKLVIVFIVVVVLLGPKRLPEVARQLGTGWRKLRELHDQVDHELRTTLPDLPSSQDIVRFVRSPVALLSQLADPRDGPSSGLEEQDAAVSPATWDGTADGDRTDRAGAPIPSVAPFDTYDPNLN